MAIKQHNDPPISYREAGDLFLIIGHGQAARVSEVDAATFDQVVQQAIQTCKNPEVCSQALEQHDYAEMVDRWHALLILQQHKARVPVSTSKQADNLL